MIIHYIYHIPYYNGIRYVEEEYEIYTPSFQGIFYTIPARYKHLKEVIVHGD